MPKPTRAVLNAKLATLRDHIDSPEGVKKTARHATQRDKRIGGGNAEFAHILIRMRAVINQDPGDITLEDLQRAGAWFAHNHANIGPIVPIRNRLLSLVEDPLLGEGQAAYLDRLMESVPEIGYDDDEIWDRLDAQGTTVAPADVNSAQLTRLLERWHRSNS